MKEIKAPKATQRAFENLLDKMYISNVSKRLRELNQPSDIDRRRWVWELIQNAKDSIVNVNRDSVDIRIVVEDNEDKSIVKFQHNGEPFTVDARLGLLYKYSEDKENSESTGRFGTGFLTTHCLSKVVSIESNIFGDNGDINGFSVTMFRDGLTEKDLLDGLQKMRETEKYYSEPFEWTTFTYHVSSVSGRRAIYLGTEEFRKNIAQVLLFCKEIASVELKVNGKVTDIKRLKDIELQSDLKQTSFSIVTDGVETIHTFVYCSSKQDDEEISKKYKSERSIRLHVACEIDDKHNIISTEGNTSVYCVFPLVGIEDQIQLPFYVNSPDFEPDSERQSLLLAGANRDEENDVITETGINQKILPIAIKLYDEIVSFCAANRYGQTYNLAYGLKSAKEHKNLDNKWYEQNVINKVREVLCNYPLLLHLNNANVADKIQNCIFIKESKKEDGKTLFELLSYLCPDSLIKENDEWASLIWKDDNIKIWNTEEVCKHIASKESITSLELADASKYEDIFDWYNQFLKFVNDIDSRFLDNYAILPNMNGDFMAKSDENFKEGLGVNSIVIKSLKELGEDVTPYLLHESVTSISLDRQFNSTSFSAKANELCKKIIEDQKIDDNKKLEQLMPLIKITISDNNKYENDFIEKRKYLFKYTKDLFCLTDTTENNDNSFNTSSWDALDKWLIKLIISTLAGKKNLREIPTGLGAKWINELMENLKIPLNTLNESAILPNQNGEFRTANKLYIDKGIPEILKDDIFTNIGINYKDILLDNAINPDNFGKTDSKNISSFVQELEENLKGYSYYSCEHGNKAYGAYRKYSEEKIQPIYRLLIQIVPSDTQNELTTKQIALRDASRFFLKESCKGNDNVIEYTNQDLWRKCNEFICMDIMTTISDSGSIQNLAEALSVNDDALFKYLNFIYKFIEEEKIPYTNRSIFPNQKGEFHTTEDLFGEGEIIDAELKDIIERISDEDHPNYYEILMDTRCTATLNNKKSLSDAYSYIDTEINRRYGDQDNWEQENFKKATQMLIEDWGESHRNIFDGEHFPKVFPKKDSICMNVVWTKEIRQQFQEIKQAVDTGVLGSLDINDIKDLSARNKELETENERLRKIIESLDTANIGDSPEDDISKKKRIEAQIEAQRFLMEKRSDWNYPEDYGKCNVDGEPYHFSTVLVTNENDEDMAIVLKSYKKNDAPFKVNPEEWEWVVNNGAKLLVYTYVHGTLDIIEVPQEDLIMNQSKISITFSSENLTDDKDKITKFAEALHYFKELHFDFDKFHIAGNARSVKNIYAKNNDIQDPTEEF